VKITLNWLRELVDVVLSPEELAETLVMAGLEVESIEERSPGWTDVEIAVVEHVAPHPNADRLRLLQVRRAGETVSVVCGASNMQAGDRSRSPCRARCCPTASASSARRFAGRRRTACCARTRELGLSEADDGRHHDPPARRADRHALVSISAPRTRSSSCR
jgi:phenylalanyl-tRNA synthetase beta chain